MKVTVERAALLKSLGHVHRVVERRNTIPILSNVLVRAEGEGLRLKATDLDMEVTETIRPTCRAPARPRCRRMCSTTLSASCPRRQVALEMASDSGPMQIRSGRSRFTLQTLPESDFPDLAAGDLPSASNCWPPTSSA